MMTTDRFADFLVRLAEKDDRTVMERLPHYLDGHLAQFSDLLCGFGSVSAERERLAVAFRDKAPRNELSQLMLNAMLELAS